MNDHSFKDEVRDLREKRILEAAVAIFSEFGFRGASMKQIARLAGVSEGTIYNVFDDKLDLLVSILDPLSERMRPEAKIVDAPLGQALSARLKTFDDKTNAMMRVLLSEALVDDGVRAQFGQRIIAPMKPETEDGAHYGVLCFVLGALLLRLLDQDDTRSERLALASFDPAEEGAQP